MSSGIVVLGGGESGVGAALLAREKGKDVFVSDRGIIQKAYKEELNNKGIPYEEGLHSRKRIFEADEVVKSPGIPDHIPLIRELRQAGVPVISEIEFASRYTNANLICITGSNGKTTTTRLIYHLLIHGGIQAGMAGNVGTSFARILLEEPRPYYVLELSSFQLDGILEFRPDIALLLNITPDHLDRYDYQLEKYVASKFRITLNQKENDLFFYNREDKNILSYLKTSAPKPRLIGLDGKEIADGQVVVDGCVFNLKDTILRGRHNSMNALFAITIAKMLGVPDKLIQEALNSFVNAPHRMEFVAEIEGVRYINDSKGTNVDATFYALDAMRRPIIWIVGGQDKGNDYSPLLKVVEQKVKAIVCMGVDNAKIITCFQPLVEQILETRSAAEAVKTAAGLATNGDVVLMSPACASFDLFKNYVDRGDQFREEVKKLTGVSSS